MQDHLQYLRATDCVTVPSIVLTAARGQNGKPQPMPGPLRDCISCDIDDPALQFEVTTRLQLIAAVQATQHPWINLDKLYRLIVCDDANDAVMANLNLLEIPGASPDQQRIVDAKTACAFACRYGVVVVIPWEVIRYTWEPTSAYEMQLGMTILWHELAHVHDFALNYCLPSGFVPLPARKYSALTRSMWHEYFAHRHSYWPGFSVDPVISGLKDSWAAYCGDRSLPKVDQLLVSLVCSDGRASARGGYFCDATPQVLNAMAAMGLLGAWHRCKQCLDAACGLAVLGQCSDLGELDQCVEAFKRMALSNSTS